MSCCTLYQSCLISYQRCRCPQHRSDTHRCWSYSCICPWCTGCNRRWRSRNLLSKKLSERIRRMTVQTCILYFDIYIERKRERQRYREIYAHLCYHQRLHPQNSDSRGSQWSQAHVCMYIYTYTNTSTHIHTYTYAFIHTYINMLPALHTHWDCTLLPVVIEVVFVGHGLHVLIKVAPGKVEKVPAVHDVQVVTSVDWEDW